MSTEPPARSSSSRSPSSSRSLSPPPPAPSSSPPRSPSSGPASSGPVSSGPASSGTAAGADLSWDPAGLDLARAVAASLSAAGRPSRPRGRAGTGARSRGTTGRSGAEATLSGAAPDDRDPQHLDAAIERLVHERGWVTEVAVAGAIARWDVIVGPEVAAHCRAVRFADGELTVQADSTAWATQVRLLAPSLVRRLNEELGDGTVRRVTVVGPSAPRWRGRSRRTRDSRGPRDTYG